MFTLIKNYELFYSIFVCGVETVTILPKCSLKASAGFVCLVFSIFGLSEVPGDWRTSLLVFPVSSVVTQTMFRDGLFLEAGGCGLDLEVGKCGLELEWDFLGLVRILVCLDTKYFL